MTVNWDVELQNRVTFAFMDSKLVYLSDGCHAEEESPHVCPELIHELMEKRSLW
jgi:hypothetical protein